MNHGASGCEPTHSPWIARLAALAAIALAALLVRAVLELPRETGGLAAMARENLHASGAAHPVTAVLLNFRGYDTWLEVGVLWMAALGVLLFLPHADLRRIQRLDDAEAVLIWLVRLLFPMLVLAAGYLLWIGKYAAGGAFQAGVVGGAAAVLLWLAGHRSITALPGHVFRLLLVAGFAGFLLAASALLLFGNRLLEFPPRWAGALILAIEAAAAVSIALTVSTLIIGMQPVAGRTEPEAP